METCDVLIIGGGPAGSSCARQLHAAGVDVIVLDKSTFPRDKVCAGWITPAVVEELDLDLDHYRHGRVCQDILGFRTATMGGQEVYNDYKHTVSFGIRRYEFDHYLLSRCGARLILNTPVSSIERQGDHWLVNGNISANMLIGAGGHFCPVARYLGAKLGKSERSVSAQEIEFEMTAQQQSRCKIDSEIPELYFYPDMSGYGWVFRKDQYINIGVGREDTGKIANAAAQFLELMQQQGKLPTDLTANFKGHAYLLYDHAQRKILDDSVLLIGDAAGLAYTESGEGIRPAIESGLLAADVILASAGDYQLQKLQPYSDMICKRFGKKHPHDRNWIPDQIRHAIAKKLIANRFLSRHIILDRYFLRSAADTLYMYRQQ